MSSAGIAGRPRCFTAKGIDPPGFVAALDGLPAPLDAMKPNSTVWPIYAELPASAA